MLCRGFHDPVRVGQRGRQGFFGDPVNAPLGGQNQRISMLWVGRAHAHHVDLASVEHGTRRVVLMPHTPAFGEVRDAGRHHIAARHEFGVVAQRRQASGMGIGDAPGADNAESNSGARHALIDVSIERGQSSSLGCISFM